MIEALSNQELFYALVTGKELGHLGKDFGILAELSNGKKTKVFSINDISFQSIGNECFHTGNLYFNAGKNCRVDVSDLFRLISGFMDMEGGQQIKPASSFLCIHSKTGDHLYPITGISVLRNEECLVLKATWCPQETDIQEGKLLTKQPVISVRKWK